MSLGRWIKDLFARPDRDLQRELLAAQLALANRARKLGPHQTSSKPSLRVLRRFKRLEAAQVARGALCEAMALLDTCITDDDYEIQLDAWIEIRARELTPHERDLVRCVRDGAVALRRGARPEHAMRTARERLGADQLPTSDITKVARDLASFQETGPLPRV